ncbi:hypothetical protein E2C01_009099 [Portunus trituberculatus]|uniref:Uncharacterized protein n=1 Tax=Portunus trituberculatus TaxID=210409 RepID=A0A5B7D406_PORTR|nr:hypothetical protein [Portunus trituberculatus]
MTDLREKSAGGPDCSHAGELRRSREWGQASSKQPGQERGLYCQPQSHILGVTGTQLVPTGHGLPRKMSIVRHLSRVASIRCCNVTTNSYAVCGSSSSSVRTVARSRGSLISSFLTNRTLLCDCFLG